MTTDNQPRLFARLRQKFSGNILQDMDALRALLQQSHTQGIIDQDTLSRLENVLNFNEMHVRDAMISRAQMDVLKTTDSIERIIAYAVDTAHSRFPVIADDKDHIIGILHAKDLLKFTLNPEQFKLDNIIRPAVFVPESKPLNTLLKEFQEQHNHMAIVVDEYGGISGLVTFEDLIEEIVGKIEDEFDEEENYISPVSAERWRVHAKTEIGDINQYFGTQYSSDEADTIGGYIQHILGKMPEIGETADLGDWQATVSKANRRQIISLHLRPQESTAEAEEA